MPTATQLRSDVRLLTSQASGELGRLWRSVEDAVAAEAALRDTLPALIDEYGAAIATVAADWYDESRDQAGVRGRFTAIPADVPDTGAQALVGWALSEARDMQGFQTLILGGTQRRLANFSRFTIQTSSVADPAAEGWVRVGSGACKSGWCDKYLDGVVRTVAYDFPAHDNCNCHAVASWR